MSNKVDDKSAKEILELLLVKRSWNNLKLSLFT